MDVKGKKLNITPSSFAEVFALKRAITDAMRRGGIKIDASGFDLDKMEIGEIGGIIEIALSVATDEKVQDCLFECCGRCLLGSGEKSEKIDVDFFEVPENRQYYYPIMFEVLKVNLSPFFGKVGLLSSGLSGITEKFLKQK